MHSIDAYSSLYTVENSIPKFRHAVLSNRISQDGGDILQGSTEFKFRSGRERESLGQDSKDLVRMTKNSQEVVQTTEVTT